MQTIKKFAAVVAAVATVAAGFPSSPVLAQARVIPASTTTTAPIVDQTALISSTIKAFPNGGEPLKVAISDLIVNHPSLANDLAAYIKNDTSLTAEQKKAIIAGLADALNHKGVVALVGPMSPALIALLIVAGGLVGWGIYEISRNNDDTVSPH